MNLEQNLTPRPKKRISPWGWFGIGCGGLFAISAIALTTIVIVAVGHFKSEERKPFDRTAVMSVIGDLPLYPGSVINEPSSRVARATLKAIGMMIPSSNSAAIALDCSVPTTKVFTWYDKELTKSGWAKLPIQEVTGRDVQHQYERNKDIAIVQVQSAAKSDSKMIVLMRFRDVKR